MRTRGHAPPSQENSSIKLGNVMGIPVRIHWTFLVMIYMVATLGSRQGDAGGTLVILGITFGSVFLHELGHSLMARRLGIQVLDITFWPLGGMARMSHMPEDARVEGLVAVAGPLVNFALAALGLVFLPLGGYANEPGWAAILISINLMIGTFNLIPAFPMDGGRILRAALARNNDWVSATEGAVKVGRFFASLMFFGTLVYSFFTGNLGLLCVMPLIAGFVWITGAKELLGVRMRHGQNPFAGSPFANAGFQGAPFGESSFGGRDPHADANAQPGSQTVERPGQGDSHGGFTEADIERLEHFHGRLPPHDPKAPGA